MKTVSIFTATTAALIWASPLAAQPLDARQRTLYVTNDAPTPEWARSSDRGRHLSHVAKASEVIGTEIRNLQEEKLGKVQTLVVDLQAGRIVEVIVSSGGFAGIGAKTFAVPPGVFVADKKGKSLLLDADKEKFKGSPEFDLAKWQESSQSNRIVEVYRYYAQEPYFAAHGALASKELDRAHEQKNTGRSWARQLGTLQRADQVIGLPVKNKQDENLGKIHELIVDLPAGRIVQALVSTGGFLGVGDELSAVPPGALHYDSSADVVHLNTTREALAKAPRFKSSQWPDFTDPAYGTEVYRAYGEEPYFSVDADNTRRNVRDRSSGTQTPLDQGSSPADLDLTTRIRKEITAREGLSVNARNVKVITVNGRVTLRGPVNSAEEKRVIEEIVKRFATSANMDNQLEVKGEAVRQ
jgi:sporulation protein YlmC with PRC-barrel domain